MDRGKRILFIIVLAQFCCTSLWFAGNSIVNDLAINFNFPPNQVAQLTSSVQFGFIIGTLVYAFLSFADRYSPSKVFFISALLAGGINLLHLSPSNSLSSILLIRFCIGFFLAGIYPVGMKIAADHFEKGLGKSLGYLVGALVLGTAFPHLLKGSSFIPSWKIIITLTSVLAFSGGILIFLLIPDGPYRKKGGPLQLNTIPSLFNNSSLRKSAIGYFGHMWELYTFWAFLPIILTQFTDLNKQNTSLWSFTIIGIGSISCVLAGKIAEKFSAKKVAVFALIISGTCCFVSPLFFQETINFYCIIIFLIIWGAAVIADSPMLSTLVAQSVPAENKGTSLTIVNCIGFSITIVSIEFLSSIKIDAQYLYLLLGLGPLIGLWQLRKI